MEPDLFQESSVAASLTQGDLPEMPETVWVPAVMSEILLEQTVAVPSDSFEPNEAEMPSLESASPEFLASLTSAESPLPAPVMQESESPVAIPEAADVDLSLSILLFPAESPAWDKEVAPLVDGHLQPSASPDSGSPQTPPSRPSVVVELDWDGDMQSETAPPTVSVLHSTEPQSDDWTPLPGQDQALAPGPGAVSPRSNGPSGLVLPIVDPFMASDLDLPEETFTPWESLEQPAASESLLESVAAEFSTEADQSLPPVDDFLSEAPSLPAFEPGDLVVPDEMPEEEPSCPPSQTEAPAPSVILSGMPSYLITPFSFPLSAEEDGSQGESSDAGALPPLMWRELGRITSDLEFTSGPASSYMLVFDQEDNTPYLAFTVHQISLSTVVSGRF